jgi:4-hydroxybenzoate polyprenyltransferase
MLNRIRLILEMIKFSHTLFALPFALLSAVMAWTLGAHEEPPRAWRWQELLGILLCMAAARSVAMAANRLADRRFDAVNPRTATRHLPQGMLSVGAVAAFAVCSAAMFVASTLLFLPNWLPLALALPVLALLVAYSYTKRFTSWSHFWLGAALMLAPVSVWIALRGDVLPHTPTDIIPAIVLGAAVMLWVAGFDVIYACQDAAFDRQAGLHSVPARWGVRVALRIAVVCHLGMIGLLVLLPYAAPQLGLGWIYAAGVAAVALLLTYEHALVRPDDLARVNVAFFHVNSIVSVGLLVMTSVDLWT